jgi:hypothetical protein
MRWFRIRRATILPAIRTDLERIGVAVVQQRLAAGGFGIHEASPGEAALYQEAALAWLSEQYDKAERKETWQITMEAAVTIFVLFELLVGIGTLAFMGYEFSEQKKQFNKQVQHQDEQFTKQMTNLDTQLADLDQLYDASQRTADILEKLEARQERIENAKPHLVMYLDGSRLPLTGRPAIKHPERSGLTVDFELGNTGPVGASGVQIRVYAGYGITDMMCLNEDVKPTHVRQRVNDTGTSVIFSIPETITNNRLTLSLSFKRNENDDKARIGSVRFEGQTKESPNWVNLGLVNIVLRM